MGLDRYRRTNDGYMETFL